LEWAFRFACEPMRLWPRVFVDGPLFLAAIAAQLLGLTARPPEIQEHIR